MKKIFKQIIFASLISFNFIQAEQVKSLVPHYYFPTIENLQKESLSIGKNAYQLLYFGQYKQSLNLAKLAVKINKKDEKLWLILAESQIANNLFKQALNSHLLHLSLQLILLSLDCLHTAQNKEVDMHFCQ